MNKGILQKWEEIENLQNYALSCYSNITILYYFCSDVHSWIILCSYLCTSKTTISSCINFVYTCTFLLKIVKKLMIKITSHQICSSIPTIIKHTIILPSQKQKSCCQLMSEKMHTRCWQVNQKLSSYNFSAIVFIVFKWHICHC